MKQKMTTAPFEAERAKRIQAGDEPGEIVTRDGRSVRVVCWDRENQFYPIIALVRDADSPSEGIYSVGIDGAAYKDERSEHDLMICASERRRYKFEPFQRVLVRDFDIEEWMCDVFSHYKMGDKFSFVCVGSAYKCCIPYNDETKHLLGTTDNWEDEV